MTFLIGLAWVLVTALVRHDSVDEVVTIGAYSAGWTFLTFGALYALTNWLEDMRWDRPDHDLVATYEAAKSDDDSSMTWDD